MRTFLSVGVLAAYLILTTGCAKDVNNKEAVKAAVTEYLAGKQKAIGLNMDSFDIEIGSVSFQQDQATANVSIKPKAGGEGMQIPYVLDLKGGKWVVRRSAESGAGGHGGGAMGGASAMPPPPPSTQPLPEGHPSIPAK